MLSFNECGILAHTSRILLQLSSEFLYTRELQSCISNQLNHCIVAIYNISVLKFQDFDTILDTLGDSPEGQPIDLVFIDPRDVYNGPATLTVKTGDGNSVQINTRKGENLRKTLLDNKIDIYGSKAKFTNCGGGASCGTCAVLINDALDWEPRADFERARLKKYSSAGRLSCNVFIEGDCTVIVQPPKDA